MVTLARQPMPMMTWAGTRGTSHAAKKAFAQPTTVKGGYWTPTLMRLSPHCNLGIFGTIQKGPRSHLRLSECEWGTS